MRCHKCQNEIPLDLRSASVPVACPGCGALLPVVPKSAERDPQEILARWSENHWLDNYGPLVGKKTPPVSVPLASASPERGQNEPGSTGVVSPAPPAASAEEKPSLPMADEEFFDVDFDPNEIGEMLEYESGGEYGTGRRSGTQIRLDGAHGPAGHHLPAIPVPSSKGANWLLTAGQVLAYFGVGALTVGTVMVLAGYYGNNAEWMPTGWLTASAGQMLLFLGVITLVSGGMEQATQEIVQRVDRLGERIIRMEQRHQGPGRPNFSKQKTGKESAGATIQRLQRRVVELEQHLRQGRGG